MIYALFLNKFCDVYFVSQFKGEFLMLRKKGFTLIELMIVVAIIAIIAAIAIPGLLRARISANEGSAIGTLRTISTSQAQFQSQAQVDQDSDGTGEYGLLAELAGTSNRRSPNAVNSPRANPTFVTPVLGPKPNINHGSKSGFLFKMYLPGTNPAITDNGTGNQIGLTPATGFTQTVVIDNQETKFRAYAWPISTRTTGMRIFCVDQAAEVLTASNASSAAGLFRYNGANTVPNYNVAGLLVEPLDNPTAFEATLTTGTGRDTQIWGAAGS